MTLPLPLEPLRCRQPDCTLAIGGRCARADEFPDPLASCPELLRAEGNVASPPPQPVEARPPVAPLEAQDAAPWKGRHLSIEDAEALVRRSPARLISVLGPFDAGKTSLMASFFLQIANAQYGTFPYRFASSRTLYGFQDLVARANRWSGKPGDATVDRTPKDDSPDAGRFLHLGVRPRDPRDDRHIDLLLSDVAGEWIEDWTRRADEEARRRLGFIPRSDGFVVVVDAAALLDAKGARMDSTVGRLLRRVVSAAGAPRGRAIAVAFSKFDRVLALDLFREVTSAEALEQAAWSALQKRGRTLWSAIDEAHSTGFAVERFAVSAFPTPLAEGQPVGVMAPFVHILGRADRRERWPRLILPVPEGASAFQAMRRHEREVAG